MTSLRRLTACVMAAVLLLGPSVASASTSSGPFPPQLPSAEEMARLQKSLASALSSVRAAQAQLDQVVADFERENDKLGQIQATIAVTQQHQDALDAELRAAQAAINKRAVSAYEQQPIGMINVVLAAKTFRQFVVAFGFVRAVTTQDSKTVQRVRSLRAEVAQTRTTLESQKVDQQNLIVALDKKKDAVEASLQNVAVQYRKVQAEVEKRKSGFAFPVKPPYSYSDTYGAPRMVGTEYYHRHEGVDIFALRGTPVVAVVDGVIERVGTDTLGGTKLWLRSPGDNWTYYYAHLSAYATGIRNGLVVHKGDVIAYVGNTGNARGTPSHLHFETHLPNGAATNPTPIVRRADPLAR